MALSQEEIYAKVQETLVDALGVDDDEVSMEATLTGDLGAESIDFLDIVFRLEKAFNIKIPRGELFPDNVVSSSEYVSNGKLTPEGLAALKARMPFADFGDFEKDPDVSRVADLFKVATIVRYVEQKLAAT